MHRYDRYSFYIMLFIGVVTSSIVTAEEISWHGFIAQGVIKADKNNFVEDDGSTSLRLTEIGLNASYRINSRLRVAGQGVYLNGGNRYEEGPRIDYLFLDVSLLNTEKWHVNLQLGRNKNYQWLYSSTRDIPHTRPSIILPQSIYFDVFRDVALGSDGAALLLNTTNSMGEWDLNWRYGTSPIAGGQTKNLLGEIAEGKLDQKYDQHLNVFWRPNFANMQMGISLLDAKFRYKSATDEILVDGKTRSQRVMLNFLYHSENWDIAAEVMKERVRQEGALSPGFFNDSTAEGGYLQGRYFVNSRLTLLARVDLFDRDRKDRNGINLEKLTGGTVPRYFGFMDSATLGLSWDFAKNWRVHSEFHRVKGTGRLAPIIIPNTELNTDKYWNIWAIEVMHWF